MFLCKIDFTSGTKYYSDSQTVIIDNIQYLGGILQQINDVTVGMSLDGDFEVNNIKLTFDNTDFYFSNLVNSENIYNIPVTIYYSEDLIEVSQYKIIEFGTLDENGLFQINANTIYGNISRNCLYELSYEDYPGMDEEVEGQVVNVYNGDSDTTYLHGRAFRVNYDADKIYLMYLSPYYEGISINFINVWDASGNNISGSCTQYDDTIDIDGITYTRCFIKNTSCTDSIITFSFNIQYERITWLLGRLIKGNIDLLYDGTNMANFEDYLQKRFFWTDEQTSPPVDPAPCYINFPFVYNSQLKGSEMMRDICNTTISSYYIKQNKLYFSWIDYPYIVSNSITISESDIIDAKYTENLNDLNNFCSYKFNQEWESQEYQNSTNFSFIPEKKETISEFGKLGNDYPLKSIIFKGYAFISAKHQTIQNYMPSPEVKLSLTLNTIGNGLNPGDILAVDYYKLKSTGTRYIRIKEIVYDYSNLQIEITGKDITYMTNLNTDCKLHIHSMSDMYNFYNMAPDSDCYVVPNGNIANVLYSNPSCITGSRIKLTSSGDYIYITDSYGIADSAKYQAAKFDILQFTHYTICAFVNFSTLQDCTFFQVYNDANNYYQLTYDNTAKTINGIIVAGGSTIWSRTSSFNPSTGTRYCIVMVKNASTVKIFIDGTRVASLTIASTPSILGSFYFGNNQAISSQTVGYVEEIYFTASDILGCSGSTTCTVPTNGFDWFGIKE